VNAVILSAIPLDKEMKRYFLRLFKRIVENNGPAFACSKFKMLREKLMLYASNRERQNTLEQSLRGTGFKVTGWLRKLFRYMDTQPEYVMSFMKLYCGPNEPIETVGQRAEAQHQTLDASRKINSTTPKVLEKWLTVFARFATLSEFDYDEIRLGNYPELKFMEKYAMSHSYSEFLAYSRKWKKILFVERRSDSDALKEMQELEPLPEMYVDFDGSPEMMNSQSLENDAWQIYNMGLLVGDDDCPISASSYSFVLDQLNDGWIWSLTDDESALEYKPEKASILDGCYVGHIHHIPKKGTVNRRSIAVPNRFLQMGMGPVNGLFERLLKKLGKIGNDCTYDQNRMDTKIQNRVTNPNLYVGSVDLHQATDHLPFSWMETIWDKVFAGRVSAYDEKSWRLFVEVSRGPWENQGYLDRWPVGQPLGCLPSFKVLGITHNLLCEALSFANGFGHSPYCILGDDIVIFNKKLRREYIALMNNAGVPLSLHKSYEGRLVEFAGKLFIANQAPFYNTDHKAITWNCLFDYQIATGTYIPWQQIPLGLKKKITKICKDQKLNDSMVPPVYAFAHYMQSQPRGSHMPTGIGLKRNLFLEAVKQFSAIPDESIPFEPEFFSGQVRMSGHPVTYLDYGYAEKAGWKQRYRKIDPWYRSKYRPVSTDVLITNAAYAIATAKNCLG
jgi:hypothetical protein